MTRTTTAANEKFWDRVVKSPGCWEWIGSISKWGYGIWQPHRGVSLRAHRVSYEATVGPIPDGLVLDHLCRNKRCVNPAHLEPVTDRVNTLRGVGPSAVNATKAACVHGHPFTTENTFIESDGRRACQACRRRTWRAVLDRQKANRAAVLCGHPTVNGTCANPTTDPSGRCRHHREAA